MMFVAVTFGLEGEHGEDAMRSFRLTGCGEDSMGFNEGPTGGRTVKLYFWAGICFLDLVQHQEKEK